MVLCDCASANVIEVDFFSISTWVPSHV
jgi:hypothetical protein